MDHLTIEQLHELVERYPGWCVSLYMPTHRAGRDTEQDPIRFKNLLKQAEDRLREKGLRSVEVQGILERAQKLQQDPAFWRYQSDGLAVFLSPEAITTFRLPVRFPELLVITDRFHLKPLLPFFASDGHFYILAISQNLVRVFEGTRHTVDEVPLETMPATMADALQYDRFEKQLQFHTSTSTGAGGGQRAAAFHGHDPSDEDKQRLVRWFRKVDDEIMKLVEGHQSPLVLAGVEYYFHLYRTASKYPRIVEKGVMGNPDHMKPEQLHEAAWPLVKPIFDRSQANAFERYQEMAAQGKTITDVAEAVQAAYHGRIDTIFVPVGVQVWGRADHATGEAAVHDSHQPGDEDLLDLAAVETLSRGGEILALDPEQMPDKHTVAAILRY